MGDAIPGAFGHFPIHPSLSTELLVGQLGRKHRVYHTPVG